MTDAIQVSAVIPCTPTQLYTAWLDGDAHTRMTGGAATVEAVPGGRHTAWDGYIEGRIVALEPARRIVQTWRTTAFPDGAPDSTLEIRLVPAKRGTYITLVHTGIPAGQGEQYRSGWQDRYFEPMMAWFGAQRTAPPRTTPPRITPPRTTPPRTTLAPTTAKRAATKTTAKRAATKTTAKRAATKTTAKRAATKTTAKRAATKRAARRAKRG